MFFHPVPTNNIIRDILYNTIIMVVSFTAASSNSSSFYFFLFSTILFHLVLDGFCLKIGTLYQVGSKLSTVFPSGKL
jgi:hypothetical protein